MASTIPARLNPHEAPRPRVNRNVLRFKEALKVLGHATNGSVQCAAIPSHGRCKKEISFIHSDILVLLDDLNNGGKESVVKVMPLMLCPIHWEKTIYHLALFIDYFDYPSSKLEDHDLDQIIIDLESAKFIKEEISSEESQFPPNSATGGQQVHVPATRSRSKGEFFGDGKHTHLSTSRLKIENLDYFPLTVPNEQNSYKTVGNGDNKAFQTQSESSGSDQLLHSISRDEQVVEDFLERATPVKMNSYASLELGVAELEITYRESLQCISMTSDGWRCQKLIEMEQLLQARRLLSASGGSKKELESLARFVLCPGHARGQIPQLYSEKWFAFAAKRLTKDEAMSNFDTEQWSTTEFFNEHITPLAELRKTRSTSNLPQTHFENRVNNSLDRKSAEPEFSTQAQEWLKSEESNLPTSPFQFVFTRPMTKSSASTPSKNSSIFSQMTAESISAIVEHPASIPSPVPAIAADNSCKSGDSDDAEDNSQMKADKLRTPNESESHALSEKAKLLVPSSIVHSGHITVSMPPRPLNVFDNISNLSSKFAEAKLSSHSASRDCHSPVNTVSTEEAFVYEDSRSDQTAKSRPNPPLSISQKAPKQLVSIISQNVIDGNIRDQILSPILRGGYVYIFKSLDLSLVKIGKSNNVERRKSQIKFGCQIGDIYEVESGSYQVKYPERVEKLVHLELQNFRAKFICQHLQGSGSASAEIEQEHREWFNVPEQVAVQSVRRWRDFVDSAYTRQGSIKEYWAQMTENMNKPGLSEQSLLKTGLDRRHNEDLNEHHKLRDERYQNWIAGSQSQSNEDRVVKRKRMAGENISRPI